MAKHNFRQYVQSQTVADKGNCLRASVCPLLLHLIWRVKHETGLFDWQSRPEEDKDVEAGLQRCWEKASVGKNDGWVAGKQTEANTAGTKHGA